MCMSQHFPNIQESNSINRIAYYILSKGLEISNVAALFIGFINLFKFAMCMKRSTLSEKKDL